MINKDDPLGIPNYGPWYFEISKEQNLGEEMIKTHLFIKSAILNMNNPEFQRKKTIQFINYGDTQLVYVLTINQSRQYTLLVNQPQTKYGVGKLEFDNLYNLHKRNKGVVEPLYYFDDGEKELYVTPYFYQARCIGIATDKWGIWIPEPNYYFRDFSDKERQIINSSMVAMLVELYDEKRKLGLSECRLDGGDFMLEKGFELEELTNESIMKKMKLIAARKLIQIDFDEYIAKMRKELSGEEHDDKHVIVGKEIKDPLSAEEIETGIQLGIENRKKRDDMSL